MIFTRKNRLRGEITIPGDKSISHRSVMFGSLAEGLTEIHGFLKGADCLSTIGCFRQMGIPIEEKGYFGCRKQRNYHPPYVRHFGRSGFYRCYVW